MLASGADLKSVSTWLGHSEVGTTGNLCLHHVEQIERAATARFNDLLGGSLTASRKACMLGEGVEDAPTPRGGARVGKTP
jgi:hypothetical protein